MPYCSCMGYGMHFPANQLGGPKKVYVMREYGLSELCVMRESTVADSAKGRSTPVFSFGWAKKISRAQNLVF